MKPIRWITFFLALVWGMTQAASLASAATGSVMQAEKEYHWVTGVIDVRSTISDGSHNLENLTDLARERGIGALLISDHERLTLEYGLFPFRKWLRYQEDRPSITTFGLEKYLKAIDLANQRYDDLLVLPGLEASPFYYWSGWPLSPQGLTAHEWERHLLVFGLENAKALGGLPTLGNRNKFFFQNQPPVVALFVVVLLLGGVIWGWKGRYRGAGIALMILALAGGSDALRIGPSNYDQYHGNQGIAPYQTFINYVVDNGGLVFWNHPETKSGTRPLPPITLDTPPYPEVLRESKNYSGIAVLSGETFAGVEPGDLWDQELNAFAQGKRQRPAWGIATSDFHRDGRNDEELGDYSTIFAVKALTRQEILGSLAKGRYYAVRGPHALQDRLLEFTVTDRDSKHRAISGELLTMVGKKITATITIEAKNGEAHSLNLRLIRNGAVIHTETGTTPLHLTIEDQPQTERASYYRLEVTSDCCRLLSNPIFVEPANHPGHDSLTYFLADDTMAQGD